MSFKIIPTPPFERELKQLAKKYPSIKKDIAALAQQLVQQPRWVPRSGMIVLRYEWLLPPKAKATPAAQG
jgi:mRNA-degrading endonuclease RelE of RelBE toxin-antitoxin system